jgi:hypothetical protein
VPSWPARSGSNGDRPTNNQGPQGGPGDPGDAGPDQATGLATGPVAGLLVWALALVLSVGLLSSVAVVAVCRFGSGSADSQEVCRGAGKEAERRWEFAVSTVVTLLAGRTLRL